MKKKIYISPLFIDDPGPGGTTIGNSEDTEILNSNTSVQGPELKLTEEQLLDISNDYDPVQAWELDTNVDGVVTSDEIPE